MLEIKKKTVKEMKNTFDGIISRLNIAELRISELKYMSIEILKLKIKEDKKRIEYPKLMEKS